MMSSPSQTGGSAPASPLAAAHQLYATGFPHDAREPHLAGVLADTLSSPGSLTRLQLALIAGTALDLPDASARPFATALEYFHTASLLLDDLPCMDDATLRRGRPCAHVVHGEGATVLAALGFINRGYRLIWAAMAAVPESRRDATARHVERCLGTSGVLDGQSYDLHFSETSGTPRAVARVALGKTVSLLRLSLVTPALLAGAEPREKQLLDRISVAWGLAYQIADDCADLSARASTGTTAGRDLAQGRPNYVLAAGREAAVARLARLLHLLTSSFDALVRRRPGWGAHRPLIQRFCAAALARPAEHPPAMRCA